MKIVFIGSGNVATHLAKALHSAGNEIAQVYSRTIENAQQLADKFHCPFSDDAKRIIPDADFYIFSVKDDVLSGLAAKMPATTGVWLHTAGSVPMDVFRLFTPNFGVIYPLQTFSKNREVDFSCTPLFIEANNEESGRKIEQLAKDISHNVHSLSSEKRRYLHLSAVFACNFANHMYTLAAEMLAEQGIGFDVLKPLIAETAAKAMEMSPQKAQTGPAVRSDRNVMDKQLDLLTNDSLKQIYRLLSESIQNKHDKQ